MTNPNPKIAIARDARGIVTVTLSRPDKGNALDREMLVGLTEACARFDSDQSVRVVVFHAEGKHFCSGADVTGVGHGGGPQISIREVCERVDRLGKPTVAVVHGACIGAGLALTASCDTVLATPDAFFAIPEVRLGFPPAELTPIFLRTFGLRFLRHHLLSGERFDAITAARSGLVHQVCTQAEMGGAVDAVADAFLRAAPGALREAKAVLLQLNANLPDIDLHAVHARTIAGDEAREGLGSFKDRRHPRWYLPRTD
jgi:methylglutaconyl-CoA hydratase